MRWAGTRTHERFLFRRVKWPSFAEEGDFGQVTGGSLTLGAFTDLKATGSVEYKGESVPDDGDLIRVYYSFVDESGEAAVRPLCTCFVSRGDEEHSGAVVSGSADMQSVLAVLADDGPGKPYQVSAGANPVAVAAGIARSLGLRVNATASSYVLGAAHLFESDETWLGVVNWLLNAANYSSAWPDAMGTVQMAPYVEPTEKPPVWEFADDGVSAMKPGLTVSDNRAGTPNTVSLWYEDDSCGIAAVATNVDDRSPVSTVSLRRAILLQETVDELTGSTTAAKLEALKQLALKRLIDRSLIEYVEIPCMYVPIETNDCVTVTKKATGVSFAGGVTAIDLKFTPGAPCKVKARKLIRPDFEVRVTGEVTWNA